MRATEFLTENVAISLSKLGKFHPGTDPLAEFVPERATAQYALHPDKWESTFYSLTNKDSDKLNEKLVANVDCLLLLYWLSILIIRVIVCFKIGLI